MRTTAIDKSNRPKITWGGGNNINSNFKDTDALESFFECITSCSINSEGLDCTKACYVKHFEPYNIYDPLKLS